MQTAIRSLFAPVHYIRTLTLAPVVAFVVAVVFQDFIAVLLATTAAAFVFSSHENRRWIVISAEAHIGGAALRLLLAFVVATVAYGAGLSARH